MDDKKIIELYFARDENAIKETAYAYGKDVTITIAPNQIIKCYLFEGEPVLSEIEGASPEYLFDELAKMPRK